MAAKRPAPAPVSDATVDRVAIAAELREIGARLRLSGENPFRARAYEAGAGAVDNLAGADLARRLAAGTLTEVPGIGAALAAVIAEIAERGESQIAARLRAAAPAAVLELSQVRGISPERARRLHDALGVGGIDELEAAARAGRVREVKGFGPKSEAAILSAIAAYRNSTAALRLIDARDAAAALAAFVGAAAPRDQRGGRGGGPPLAGSRRGAHGGRGGARPVGDWRSAGRCGPVPAAGAGRVARRRSPGRPPGRRGSRAGPGGPRTAAGRGAGRGDRPARAPGSPAGPGPRSRPGLERAHRPRRVGAVPPPRVARGAAGSARLVRGRRPVAGRPDHPGRHPRRRSLSHRPIRWTPHAGADGARRRRARAELPDGDRPLADRLLRRGPDRRSAATAMGRDRARAGAGARAAAARDGVGHPGGRRARLPGRRAGTARRDHRQHPWPLPHGRAGP